MALLYEYAPALSKKQIVFQFTDKLLVASLFDQPNTALVHCATSEYALDNQIIDGMIINRVKVASLITTFIAEQNVEYAGITFIFDEPFVQQEIVYRSDKAIQDYLAQTWKDHQRQSHYLFSWEHEFCFYVCAIAQPALFGYMLLASGRPLQAITTRFASLLRLYKQQHKSLSQSQLALTMRAHEHTVPIDYAKLADMFTLPKGVAIEHIAPAIGAVL